MKIKELFGKRLTEKELKNVFDRLLKPLGKKPKERDCVFCGRRALCIASSPAGKTYLCSSCWRTTCVQEEENGRESVQSPLSWYS